jgi:hypothetical protein
VRRIASSWYAFLVVLCCPGALAAGDCDRKTTRQWDEGEASILRGSVLPKLAALPDHERIRDAFEKAIAGDPAAGPMLLDLVGHTNKDVAAFAAAALGRFPSPEATSRLKLAFEKESRDWVRIGALAGLQRMRDPDVGSLAVSALSDPSEQVRVTGGTVLAALGDGRYGDRVLALYELHPDDEIILDWLGCVGDAPGSTVVQDRLVADANNKSLRREKRVRAARALEEMGQADLVRRILDWDKGDQTHQRLGVIEGAIMRAAARKGVVIESQATVDALLRESNLAHPDDMWHHLIRLKFVREGEIRASSDGPDRDPNTPDDLTTAESYGAWARRVFPDVF